MTGKHDVNLPSKVVYVVRLLPQIKVYCVFWFIEFSGTLSVYTLHLLPIVWKSVYHSHAWNTNVIHDNTY